jgi:hypothetical protein
MRTRLRVAVIMSAWLLAPGCNEAAPLPVKSEPIPKAPPLVGEVKTPACIFGAIYAGNVPADCELQMQIGTVFLGTF